MEAVDGGGPAFPVCQAEDDFYGMTLRDYFAAKAMQGILQTPCYFKPPDDFESVVEQLPSMAYEIADAMLKERE